MALTLYVDGDRWRAHLTDVLARQPRAGPGRQGQRLRLRPAPAGPQGRVAGRRHPRRRHLRRAAPRRPAVRRVAARAHAVATVRAAPSDDPRVIHTVGRLEDLEALAAQGGPTDRPRVVARADDLDAAPRVHAPRDCARRRAWSLRPAASASRGSRCTCRWPGDAGTRTSAEVERLMNDVVAAGIDSSTTRTHDLGLPPHRRRARAPGRQYPDFTFRPRIGTALWLGDRGALSVRATVLDAHPVERGDIYGYRGRTAPRAGTILIVSGGTSHGIGLEAPTGDADPEGAGRLDRARWPRRGRVRAFAVHRGRQAAALRRAPAHAGLDAVHPRRVDRCPPWATRSTAGCGSPRRPSTPSRSAEDAGRSRVPRVAPSPDRARGVRRRAPPSRPGRAAPPPGPRSRGRRPGRRRRPPPRASRRGRSRRPAR